MTASCALIDGVGDEEEPPVNSSGGMTPDGGFASTSLIIRGFALPDSQVVVGVGGRAFDGTADSNGRYSITIPTGTANQVVTVRTIGSQNRNQERIELASSLDVLEELRILAGADDVLSEEEELGTRVTALTTARYVLLTEANGGTHPVSQPQLFEADYRAGESFYPGFLSTAAVIQAFIDEPGRPLPSSFTSTLQWASDSFAVREYVDELERTGTLVPLLEALPVTSGLFTVPIDGAELSSYYAAFTPKRNGTVGGVGYRWSFDANRTGTVQNNFGLSTFPAPREVSFSWSVDRGGLVVDYNTPVTESFPVLSADEVIEALGGSPIETEIRNVMSQNGPLQFRLSTVRSRVWLVPGGRGADWVIQRDVTRYHFREAFFPFDLEVDDAEVTEVPGGGRWIRQESLSFMPFSGTMIRGRTWVLRVLVPAPRRHFLGDFDAGDNLLTAAFVTFNDDANRTAVVEHNLTGQPITMNWTLQNGEIVLDYPNGIRQRFALFEQVDREVGVWTWIDASPVSYFDYFRATAVDPPSIPTQTQLLTPPGQYWQTTINQAAFPPGRGELVPENQIFGFLFAGDGTARRLSRIGDDGLPVYEDFWVWGESDGWFELRGFDDANMGLVRCDVALPTCTQWRLRQWRLVKLDNGWLYVLERSFWRPIPTEWDPDSMRWLNGDGSEYNPATDLEYFIAPRLNAYYLFDQP